MTANYVCILIAIVIYTYFAKNVYNKVEKLITACIIVMILAIPYIRNAISNKQ